MLIRFPFCGKIIQVIFCSIINSAEHPSKEIESADDENEAHMGKRYAIRRIDVEGLSLRLLRAACGWIPD